MEFQNITNDEFAQGSSGRRGYALEALAYGQANPGQPFAFAHTSPNAAARLRTLGLTVKSQRVNKPETNAEGKVVFDHVILKCVYTADSREAVAARATAANPKPKPPKKAKGEGKAKKSEK